MDPVNFKTFSQQMGKLIKAIEHQTEVNEKIAQILERINLDQNLNEIALNTRINDDSVFVTKLKVGEISEKEIVASFALMLKSLGNVLLITDDAKQEEKKSDNNSEK